MNQTKFRSFLISGLLLGYFALQDLPEFNIIYNGAALLFSIGAFIIAGLEYLKKGED
ncbi:hypothetical protein GCM10009122_35550 [Fulvivirga kasyanovii]|uniref:hypothetical protein n=1 Tax=Fulvivirga kasyanovii TaxID=396812 RepID=UPI0012BC130A|nr:hypothetical protein [Fulvivirga kasyanovii]